MSLRETLNSIMQSVDGALAAVIMAYDGIPIDEVIVEQSDFDTQLLSVEYAAVFNEIRRSVDVMSGGDMEEVSITTTQTSVIMRALNDQMFVALIMGRSGSFGKGRYILRSTSNELMRELE